MTFPSPMALRRRSDSEPARRARRGLALRAVVEGLEARTLLSSVPGNAWVAEFGHAGNDQISGAAGDGGGSLYVVGGTNFGLSGQGTAGAYDGFARKMDAATGTAAWERYIGTTGDDRVLSVAASMAGVFVGGFVQGALPGQVHAGSVDAFVRRYDAGGNVAWTRQFGSSFNESITALAMDDSGVYAAGYTEVNLAGLIGGTDAFLRKYDFNGNVLWTHQFGSPSNDTAGGVAVLDSGVYVTGRTFGSLPGHSSAGNHDAFLAKFDADDGAPSWTSQFGSTSWDEPRGIAIDSTGVYVVGQAAAALPGETAIGSFDSFVSKYDHVGNALWTDQFGTTSSDQSMGVAADNSGVYVVGTVFGALAGQASPGNNDAYVRRYDHDGNADWLDQFGTPGADTGAAVAIDATGIYAAGVARGSLSGQPYSNQDDGYVRKLEKTDPGTPLPATSVDDHYDHAQDSTLSVSAADGLLANDFFDPSGAVGTAEILTLPSHGALAANADGSFSYTPAAGYIGPDHFTYRARQGGTPGTIGTVTIAVETTTPPFDWFRSFGGQRPSSLGGPSADLAAAIAADDAGNTFAVGYTTGAFPGYTYLGDYGDAWLRKHDIDGNVAWTRQFGTDTTDQAHAVAVDASGNIYVAGTTFGTFADAVDTSVPSGPNSDVFVRKYSPAGAVLWTRQFGNASHDQAHAIAVDDEGNVYVGGSVMYTLVDQTSAGGGDAYVVKYDPSGATLWIKQFGTMAGDSTKGLAIHGSALYAFGETGGVMAGAASLGGAIDVFITRLAMSDGTALWTRQRGTSGTDQGYGAAADASGVYVAGSLNTAGAALPGQQPLGGGDAYVIKLNADGTDGWARQFGTPGFDQAFGVAVDGGGVYSTGITSGTFRNKTSLGGTDAFVSKIDLDGTLVWTNQFGTSVEDRSPGIAVGGPHLFVVGYSAGNLPTQANTGSYDAFVARMTLAAAPTNAAPVLETNAGLFVASPGSTVPITAAQLKVTDADSTTVELTYTLTAAPTRGTLTKLVPAADDDQDNDGDNAIDEPGESAAIALGVGGSFTQADIDAGRLSYVHGGSAQATDGFTFTIADGSTNPSAASTFAIVVNRPPAADAGEAITLPEGVDLVLNGLASSDPDGAFGDAIASYAWTVDGVPLATTAGPLATIPWSVLVGSGLSGRGSYTVGLTARDSHGLSGTATTALHIVNAPPTASITGTAAGVAGQVLTFDVSAFDPSASDRDAGFSYWFDWVGDAHYDYVHPGRAVGAIAVSHAYASPGTYSATVWAVDQSGVDSAPAVFQVVITALTQAAVQSSIEEAVAALPASGSGSVNYRVDSNDQVSNVIDAVNMLASPAEGKQVEVVLNLGAGTYEGQTVSPPAGVTLVINGSGGQVIIRGASPALEVLSGSVIYAGVTFVNDTDSPTILVSGGHLTLRDCLIEESTAFDQAAVRITGGTVDLGTEADPGSNTINVNGPGDLIRNAGSAPVAPADTEFTIDGVPLAPSSLSGVVFEDYNNDGEMDLGERGIAGVTITLVGTDFLGDPVHREQQTDSDGAYVFLNLLPGTYWLAEAQPAGYSQGINRVGTEGGSASLDRFDVELAASLDALNYNYGERPPATGAVGRGQTAGIGFWNNKHGQALIRGLNGGVGTQLGDWLAATFPNMFGPASGAGGLAGKDNAHIAAYFQGRFVLKGEKLDAQVLATALSVYVTNATLNDTGVGSQYGFDISGNGAGTATLDVGDNGDAFGVANHTTMTLMALLLAADEQAVDGVLYSGNTSKRLKAINVFGAINQAGRI